MINEYYTLLDWDLASGVPSEAVLRKVGLENYSIGRASKSSPAAILELTH